MDYIQGGFSLIGLSISFVFFLVSSNWIIRSPSNNLASYWLLALSTVTFCQYLDFLYISLQALYKWPILYLLIDAIAVLLPMCAYGYMRALQGHNIFLNKTIILGHLIPSMIIFIAGSHLWFPMEQSEIQLDFFSSWVPSSPNGNLYWGIVAVFSLFYWWRQRLHGYQSKGMVRIKFIQDLLLLNVISVFIQIVSVEFFGLFIPMVYAQGPFAAYFIYRALSFSVLPQVVSSAQMSDSEQVGKIEAPIDEEKDSSKKLSPDELSVYKSMFDTLEEALKKGAYRDNELSLGSLAEGYGLTYHQASIAINQFSGMNFYEWVRLYRIEESKEILAKTTLSVSTIYYDVGFNSKSSFYTAFKKIVGCTPTEYRKQAR